MAIGSVNPILASNSWCNLYIIINAVYLFQLQLRSNNRTIPWQQFFFRVLLWINPILYLYFCSAKQNRMGMQALKLHSGLFLVTWLLPGRTHVVVLVINIWLCPICKVPPYFFKQANVNNLFYFCFYNQPFKKLELIFFGAVIRKKNTVYIYFCHLVCLVRLL